MKAKNRESLILEQNQTTNQNKDSAKNLVKSSNKIPSKTVIEIFHKMTKKKKSSNPDSEGKTVEFEV